MSNIIWGLILLVAIIVTTVALLAVLLWLFSRRQRENEVTRLEPVIVPEPEDVTSGPERERP